MAIRQERFVDIKSMSVSNQVSDRELAGLVFSTGRNWTGDGVWDPEDLLKVYSPDQVIKYFKTDSEEAAFAAKYFSYMSPLGMMPASLTFCKMKTTDAGGNALIWDSDSDGWMKPGECATGTVTVDSAEGIEGWTVTVGGTTYTFKGFRKQPNDVLAGETAEECAAALADCINGKGYYGQTENPDVSATVEGAVITLTAKVRGTGGNGITLGVEAPEADGSDDGSDDSCLIPSGATLTGGTADEAYAGTPESETPSAVLARVNGKTNNFGSFAFAEEDAGVDDRFNDDNLKAVAEQNAAYNYKYLFASGKMVGKGDDATDISDSIKKAKMYGKIKGTNLTQGADKVGAAMPMAIFAATDYTAANAAPNFMFKQFPGEVASVTDDESADRLDDLFVNFYGQTQANGQELSFYQSGFNLDGEDTAVYCNEIWLKSAIATEILNLMVAVNRIPANINGRAMLWTAISAVAGRGVTNGVIEVGKTLTTTQRQVVNQITNDPDAVSQIENNGYWLDVVIEQDGNKYYAVYTLVYGKGDSIRKVEGRDLLV